MVKDRKPSIASTGRSGGSIQTVETVSRIFAGFVSSEPQPMLKSLSECTGMHPAKIHRYLVSLVRGDYVRQDPGTALYRLGPAAIRLGQAALAAVPVVSVARKPIEDLVAKHDRTVFLALWTKAGPRIVLQQQERAALTIAAHVGSLFPLLPSSTGRTFAAWLPRDDTESLLRRELDAMAAWPVEGCPASWEDAMELFAEIRRRKLERATGQLSPGIHGISTPVFDPAGAICAVVTMLGHADGFDSTWDGPFAQSLTETASRITALLDADFSHHG